jgi:hypothetical protein
MKRLRGVLPLAALCAVLAGTFLLATVSSKGPRAPWEPPGAESPGGPEVILRDVVLREVRKEGAHYRLTSEQATYRILAGRVSATGVTLELPGAEGEGAGEGVVTAPKADWNMENGQIVLPEGGIAESGAGWSAEVVAADLSLPGRVLTSTGKARFSGPGLVVVGDNLVWHWKDGKVALERPNTRIEPARAQGRRR